jgi:hypothetical protein
MESCVAVLEQIARTQTASLERIERRMDAVSAEQRSDFRWLLGIMLGGFGAMLGGFSAVLGIMAHGFHRL